MKKLLAVAPFAVLLAACATNAPTTTTTASGSTNNQVQTLTCEDNGKVTAAYTANGQIANLTVSLPKIGLNNAKISLKQVASGSGARYVNDTNPKTTFDWHSKADQGIMTISSKKGQQYSVNCQV